MVLRELIDALSHTDNLLLNLFDSLYDQSHVVSQQADRQRLGRGGVYFLIFVHSRLHEVSLDLEVNQPRSCGASVLLRNLCSEATFVL